MVSEVYFIDFPATYLSNLSAFVQYDDKLYLSEQWALISGSLITLSVCVQCARHGVLNI